jgi:predicted metal-dependent enzyme (double-stranded beta helix superfamily)
MGNPSKGGITCSLHIYSPPYRECSIFKVLQSDRTTAPSELEIAAGASAGTESATSYHCSKEKIAITALYGKEHTFMTHPASGSPQSSPLHEPPASPVPEIHSLAGLTSRLLHVFRNVPAEERTSEIHAILDGISFSEVEWKQYVHFCPQRYARNLLVLNSEFSLILNCWTPGQSTPIHDHGSESRQSWVRVLEGELLFTEYEADHQVKSRQVFSEHGLNFFVDNSHLLHKLENISSDTSASLHLYSPPYVHCAYIDNAGAHRHLPASFCGASKSTTKSCSITRLRTALLAQQAVFTNFRAFSSVISSLIFESMCGRKAADTDSILNAALAANHNIIHALKAAQFNQDEWLQYTPKKKPENSPRCPHAAAGAIKPCFLPVACSDACSIYIAAWPSRALCFPQQPIPAARWIRVLEGTLEETQFETTLSVTSDPQLVETQSTTLLKDSVLFRSIKAPARLLNATHHPAFSLHIFSPPCHFSCSPGPSNLESSSPCQQSDCAGSPCQQSDCAGSH